MLIGLFSFVVRVKEHNELLNIISVCQTIINFFCLCCTQVCNSVCFGSQKTVILAYLLCVGCIVFNFSVAFVNNVFAVVLWKINLLRCDEFDSLMALLSAHCFLNPSPHIFESNKSLLYRHCHRPIALFTSFSVFYRRLSLRETIDS